MAYSVLPLCFKIKTDITHNCEASPQRTACQIEAAHLHMQRQLSHTEALSASLAWVRMLAALPTAKVSRHTAKAHKICPTDHQRKLRTSNGD